MYLDLKVKEVINETPDAISVVFERPAGVNFKAGQFLTLIININNEEIRRSYSLCSAPFEMDKLAVSVKRVEGGLISNYLNDKVKTGDSIKVMEPMGTFIFEPNSTASNRYVLFGGGSGITPMMSILKTVLKEEPSSTVTLVFANRDKNSIIFKSEIEKLSQSENLKVIHILENNSGYDALAGRITPDVVKSVINDDVTGYYMCGPTPMMDAVTNSLQAYGVNNNIIYKESFTADTSAEESYNSGVGTKTVKIIYEGDEFLVEVEEGESILDAALDDNIDLPYSCQGGVCTACRGKCLSGKIDLTDVEGLSDSEMEQGYVLTCVGHPLTDDVIVEIG